MATLNEKLLRDALSLPLDQRTELVDKLLASLNAPLEAEIEQAWAEEAEKRLEEIDSGKEQAIPGEDVFEKTRARYHCGKLF